MQILPNINMLVTAMKAGMAAKRKRVPLAEITLDPLTPDPELNLAFQIGYHFVQPTDAEAAHIQVNGTEDGDVQWLMIDSGTGQGTAAVMSKTQFLRVMEYLDLCRSELR
jgi:hypothetical protein